MFRNSAPSTNARTESDPDDKQPDGYAHETPDGGTNHPRANRGALNIRANVRTNSMANLLSHSVTLKLVPVPGADDNDNYHDDVDRLVLPALRRSSVMRKVQQQLPFFAGARCLP